MSFLKVQEDGESQAVRRSAVRTLAVWEDTEEFRRGAGRRTVRAKGRTPGASAVATVPNFVALPSSFGSM